MTKPILDLDALQAAARAVIENDGGTEHHYLMEKLNEVCPPAVLDALIDRLRKAEADTALYRKACASDDNAEALYAAVINNAGDQAAIDAEFAAAPDSTPTDSEGEKG